MQDLLLALRLLRKSPGATALSVLSMALGIGLTTAGFSIGDSLRLRPFPVDRPAELLTVSSRNDEGRNTPYGWPEYEDMAGASAGVLDLAAYQRRGATLITENDPELLLAYYVTPNWFPLVGARPLLGQASVEPRGGRPAAVLGYRFWQRRFGGDPTIVGKTILLRARASGENAPFVVSGVMQAEFTGLVRGFAGDIFVSTDSWFDIVGDGRERQQRDGQFQFIARLEKGVTPQAAAARLDAAIRGPGKRRPSPPGAPGTVLTARFAPDFKTNLIVGGGMLIALGLVLFVACANVAHLRLAQAEARRRELGIRMALGAGGWRVIRQLLVETSLIAVAGAGLGLILARLLMTKASEFLSSGNSYVDYGLRLDHRVLAFALFAVVFTVLMAGLAPAREVLRVNVVEGLKSEQGATGARLGWQKKLLLVSQLSVSVALFGTAVLFLQSLRTAVSVRPGLDPNKKLLVMTVGPGWRSQTIAWCEQACERLSALPGVRGATFARRLPLSGSGGGAAVRVELPGEAPLGVKFNNVGGNYFSLMGTHIIAGRAIDGNDRPGSAPIVVVSQHLARLAFPGRSPLNEWISVDGRPRQVVGVAEDGPSNDIREEPAPYLYLPFAQVPSSDITLMIEVVADPAALAGPARQALKRLDPNVTVFDSTTLRRHMDQALSQDRMMAGITVVLGLFGILLTAVGLFGGVQHTVERRTRELGLRMALGGSPATIRRMLLVEALRLAMWGVPAGLGLLVAVAWYVRSMVLGVSPLDPWIYLTSAAAAAAIALSAAWVPALRATRVDPIAALRAG